MHVCSKDRLTLLYLRILLNSYCTTVANGLNQSVKLFYLPPYLPDLNPIEEYFAELKAFIKRNWEYYAGLAQGDFGKFLEWCVDIISVRKQSAEGHFWHAGVSIEEL